MPLPTRATRERARRRRYICRMLGTEDGRYDASEHAHDALLPVLSLAALGTRTRALRRGRQFASTRPPHILKRDGATMQSARFISSPRPRAVRVAPRRLNQLDSKCNSLLLIDHHAENGSGDVTQIQPCFTDL